MKQCRNCGQEKPLSEYHKANGKVGGDSWCKVCRSAYRKAKYDPEHKFYIRIKNVYGLSKEQYLELKDRAGGVCEICNTPFEDRHGYHMVIDHCHKTGVIRGLLCNKCNQALGLFNDSKYVLRNAIKYLEIH